MTNEIPIEGLDIYKAEPPANQKNAIDPRQARTAVLKETVDWRQLSYEELLGFVEERQLPFGIDALSQIGIKGVQYHVETQVRLSQEAIKLKGTKREIMLALVREHARLAALHTLALGDVGQMEQFCRGVADWYEEQSDAIDAMEDGKTNDALINDTNYHNSTPVAIAEDEEGVTSLQAKLIRQIDFWNQAVDQVYSMKDVTPVKPQF